MSAPRFAPRFALLDLELRRLLREPWLPLASLMLIPICALTVAAAWRVESAPGVVLFGQIAWWWCLAAHVVFIPLMGTAFRGEDTTGDFELLQVSGFSPLGLLAGLLLSRLIAALLVLLIPLPLLVLCLSLGGMSGNALAAACFYLPHFFLLLALVYSTLGLLLRKGALYWPLAICTACFLHLGSDGLAQDALRGHFLAAALVADQESSVPWGLVGTMLLESFVLLAIMRLLLGFRLLHGGLTATGETRTRRRGRKLPRPRARLALPWKERWFGLGGASGHWIRLGWAPVALVVLHAFAWGSEADPAARAELVTAWLPWCGGLALVASIALGLIGAHRLFAAERREGTLDDLVLALGRPMAVICGKLDAYRLACQDFWRALVLTALLGFLSFVPLLAQAPPSPRYLMVLLFIPAGWLVHVLQQTFVARLFLAWSRDEVVPGVALARELVRFFLSVIGCLVALPISVLMGLYTLVLAVVAIPWILLQWVRMLLGELRRRQRELILHFCAPYGELPSMAELDRLVPPPQERRRGAPGKSFHPRPPVRKPSLPPPLPPSPSV